MNSDPPKIKIIPPGSRGLVQAPHGGYYVDLEESVDRHSLAALRELAEEKRVIPAKSR
jgi:hypothetical protein